MCWRVEYGVTNPQTVTDEFTEGAQDYLEYAQYLPGVALLSLALDVLTVLLVVFLCLGAGRRRDRRAYFSTTLTASRWTC